MKRMILGFALVVSLCFSSTLFAGEQDFILVNKTGLTVVEFYCSPSESDVWEEDVLSLDVLEDGEEVEIRFAADTDDCLWDLMIVDEEGDEIVWSEIDLCLAIRITLYYEDGEPTAEIEKVK